METTQTLSIETTPIEELEALPSEEIRALLSDFCKDAEVTFTFITQPDFDRKSWKVHEQQIKYNTTTLINGIRYQGTYSAGTAHIKRKGKQLIPFGMKTYEASEVLKEVFKTGKYKGKLIDAPDKLDYLYCLFMDASCDLQADSFEDFCENYGYDTDSIKAKNTYDECIKTGQFLRRAYGAELASKLYRLFLYF